MSEFDPEKERERLREQYEREQQKREATEKMSELLLQGATMTNAHCSECNDPIFRYDGQEFCPTCERVVEREAETTAETTEDSEDAEEIQVTDPDETRVRFGAEDGAAAGETDEPDRTAAPDATVDTTAPEAAAGTTAPEAAADTTAPEAAAGTTAPEAAADTTAPETAADTTAPEAATPANEAGSEDSGELPARPGRSDSGTADAGGDLTAARQSLTRTLTRYARAGEAAEDPAQAREYLAVAREAARTLDALRR